MIADILTWAGYWSGITNEAGRGYAMWSGILSLGYLGGLALVYRKLNCHTRHCWRVGLHHVDGSPFVVCKKHHPTVPKRGATVAEIHQAHAERTRR